MSSFNFKFYKTQKMFFFKSIWTKICYKPQTMNYVEHILWVLIPYFVPFLAIWKTQCLFPVSSSWGTSTWYELQLFIMGDNKHKGWLTFKNNKPLQFYSTFKLA